MKVDSDTLRKKDAESSISWRVWFWNARTGTTEAGKVLRLFAYEPFDTYFMLFAALAGVACEKRESDYLNCSSNASTFLFNSAFSSFNL